MKRSYLLLAVLALLVPLAGHLQADTSCPQGSMDAFAFETLTVTNASKAFTAATAFPDGLMPGRAALVTVKADAIRFRADGLAPTDSVGHYVAADETLSVCGTQNMKQFRMIRVTTDATVSVTYFR